MGRMRDGWKEDTDGRRDGSNEDGRRRIGKTEGGTETGIGKWERG